MKINLDNHKWLRSQKSQTKFGYNFYGRPIFKNKTEFKFHEIEGIWFAIKIENNFIEIISDVCSSHRVYYETINNVLFLYDTLDKIKNKEINENAQIYFNENGYFFGSDTIYTSIYRLPGLVKTKVTETKITETDLFFSIKNNNTDFKSDLIFFLKESTKERHNSKVILMFSGGFDSIAIAKCLIELDINFTSIFFDDCKRDGERKKALKSAKKLNLDFEIIKLELGDELDYLIDRYQKFDKHYSKLHYYAAREISELYGNDSYVINGQGSDSVLSLGPSETSLQSFLKRAALYSPWPLRFFINLLLSLIYRKLLYIGNDSNKFYQSFSSFKRYLLINYENKCSSYLNLTTSKLFIDSSKIKKLLSIKRFGFIMGSDNQVVINSLKAFNINRIIMPFSSVFMFKHSIYNTDRFKEIYSPKKIVK